MDDDSTWNDGATYATSTTVPLIAVQEGEGNGQNSTQLYMCPKHPDGPRYETPHAYCSLCEHDFQKRRQELQQQRAAVQERLTALNGDDGTGFSGSGGGAAGNSPTNGLSALQASLQQWKPQAESATPEKPSITATTTAALPPRHPGSNSNSNNSPPGSSVGGPPPAPGHVPIHPQPPMPAPLLPQQQQQQQQQQQASSSLQQLPSANNNNQMDALTMQLQRMQHMQDWMLLQKESECLQLKQLLDEARAQIQELRVENALLTEKLVQREEGMQRELKFLKLAFLRKQELLQQQQQQQQQQQLVVASSQPQQQAPPQQLMSDAWQPFGDEPTHNSVPPTTVTTTTAPPSISAASASRSIPANDASSNMANSAATPASLLMAPSLTKQMPISSAAPATAAAPATTTAATTAHAAARAGIGSSNMSAPESGAASISSAATPGMETKSLASASLLSVGASIASSVNQTKQQQQQQQQQQPPPPQQQQQPPEAIPTTSSSMAATAAAAGGSGGTATADAASAEMTAGESSQKMMDETPEAAEPTTTTATTTSGNTSGEEDNKSSSDKSQQQQQPEQAPQKEITNASNEESSSNSNNNSQSRKDALERELADLDAGFLRSETLSSIPSNLIIEDQQIPVVPLNEAITGATNIASPHVLSQSSMRPSIAAQTASALSGKGKDDRTGTHVLPQHNRTHSNISAMGMEEITETWNTNQIINNNTSLGSMEEEPVKSTIQNPVVSTRLPTTSTTSPTKLAPVTSKKSISFPDNDLASVGQTVASSTYGEDRQNVTRKQILDPYGDSGEYTGVILRSTGMPHGAGKMIYQEDKRTYDGEWRHGRWHGYGRATFANGDNYVGEYRFDQRHGSGRYEWHDGRVYDGLFREDKRHGKGRFEWPDGAVYDGEFRNGQREGQGVYSFSDGGCYEGSWKDGRYSGFGICAWEDGRCYKGEWLNGMAHGKGVETFADGSIRHDGQWREDEPVTN